MRLDAVEEAQTESDNSDGRGQKLRAGDGNPRGTDTATDRARGTADRGPRGSDAGPRPPSRTDAERSATGASTAGGPNGAPEATDAKLMPPSTGLVDKRNKTERECRRTRASQNPKWRFYGFNLFKRMDATTSPKWSSIVEHPFQMQ